jgi:hypothetical protein
MIEKITHAARMGGLGALGVCNATLLGGAGNLKYTPPWHQDSRIEYKGNRGASRLPLYSMNYPRLCLQKRAESQQHVHLHVMRRDLDKTETPLVINILQYMHLTV